MERIKGKFVSKYENNKKTIWLVLFSVFAFGFIAHGFMFSNIAFSHDSLNEFNAEVYGHLIRVQFGRFLVPLYRVLTRGVVAIPWVIGILSLIYLSITVLLVVKMLNIKSTPVIVLTSGIFTVNMAVVATTATYIHDLDCDMLALLFATIGAYLWAKCKKGYLWGIIPCVLSLGLYQSYISVAITLIIFASILSVIDTDDYNGVFKKGLKGVGMILGSGVIYAILIKISLLLTHSNIVSGSASSLDNLFDKSISDILFGIVKTYVYVPYKILLTDSIYDDIFIIAINLAFVLLGIALLFAMLKKISSKSRLLVLALLLVMPFGMNLAGLLTAGNTHDLMHYAFWLVYLFVLLVVYKYCKKNDVKVNKECTVKLVAGVLASVILVSNVYTANSIYLKKKMEYDATQMLLNRVMCSVENYEGYVPGVTKVVLVGDPTNHNINEIKGLDKYSNIVGLKFPYSIGVNNEKRSKAYFNYVFMNDVAIADEDTFVEMNLNDEVIAMPMYPQKGSIKYIDDILVVKLGEPYIKK